MSINNEERETKAARLQSDRQADWPAIYVLIRWRRIISPKTASFLFSIFLRKEVIQPQVPLRLPCYSHGVTGGVYKARERIHRVMLLRDY